MNTLVNKANVFISEGHPQELWPLLTECVMARSLEALVAVQMLARDMYGGIIDGWHIATRGQPLNENPRVLRILYVYFAFVVFCACDYLNPSGSNEKLNDYEDTRFCQHIRLDIPCTIVSADKRQIERLKNIFKLIETVAVPELGHAHEVCAVEELPMHEKPNKGTCVSSPFGRGKT